MFPFYFNKTRVDNLSSGDDSGSLGSDCLCLLDLELGSSSVQISAALAGESAATIGVLLGELQTLQGLQSFPGNATVTTGPVRGREAVVLTDSVDLADSGNSNWRPGKISLRNSSDINGYPVKPDVHVPGHGIAPDEEPIFIIRSLNIKDT